jgi:hypothetical protein
MVPDWASCMVRGDGNLIGVWRRSEEVDSSDRSDFASAIVLDPR